MQDSVELILTLPILLLLLYFIAPAVRQIVSYPTKHQLQFGIIPTIYYFFDYLAVVYTDLLVSGSPVVVEFMPFVCCVAYLAFWMYHSTQQEKAFQLRYARNVLEVQLNQSVQEINALRESQALARQYRHDLRHHLQHLHGCIESGQYEHAQSYITGICQEIETQKVKNYCENEAANLILSAFVNRAEKAGVQMKIQGSIPASIKVSESDLCVLLSNALENALHACQHLVSKGIHCSIDMHVFYQKNKFFLQITNPCEEDIHFVNGIPTSDRLGHGIGVQSICSIVERYDGVCTFLVQDSEFILRLSI